MAEILICPPRAVTQKAKRLLESAGVIVVETEDPAKVSFVRSSEVVSHSDLLWAALGALNKRIPYADATKHREEFVSLVFGLVDSERKQRIGSATSVDAVARGSEASTD